MSGGWCNVLGVKEGCEIVICGFFCLLFVMMIIEVNGVVERERL